MPCTKDSKATFEKKEPGLTVADLICVNCKHEALCVIHNRYCTIYTKIYAVIIITK